MRLSSKIGKDQRRSLDRCPGRDPPGSCQAASWTRFSRERTAYLANQRREGWHRLQAALHVWRSDCQQISAHPSERNASWMSVRLSSWTRRRRRQRSARRPSARGPARSRAWCGAQRPTARYAAPAAHAEWRLRRRRDPRAHSLAAVLVAPVRRAAGELHRPAPGLLTSRSDSRR
jgi:hypothetical protein